MEKLPSVFVFAGCHKSHTSLWSEIKLQSKKHFVGMCQQSNICAVAIGVINI